jgi:hypothetical protein
MQRVAGQAVSRTPRADLPLCFPEWAAVEVDRLLAARQIARSRDERAQVELQIAALCDAAQRYGRSLLDAAEL